MRAVAVILIAAAGRPVCRAETQLTSYAYRAASYVSVAGVSQGLEIFPFAAKAFTIALPFPLGPFAFSPNGKALYGARLFDNPARPPIPGLFKVDLDPIRATAVRGSEAVGVESLAVSEHGDKIIIAGGERGAPCGIFELTLASAAIRRVVTASPCDPLNISSHWLGISVSPDGTRATAHRNHHLDLIDLVAGTVTQAPDDFLLGAWSPDGKWLAAVKAGSNATVLLDARTLEQRRVIGMTDLVWSPDSRYLLAKNRQIPCGPEAATLQMVDVDTGKRIEIRASKCLIDRDTVGWVSEQVTK
jgi:hypothetical protein